MERGNKSTPKNIISLYTKIPDYSEVKHLGNSDFINTIEKLKEEFRQIRSSLFEESDPDLELITEKTTKVVNIRERDRVSDTKGGTQRPKNYLSSRCNSSGTYFFNNGEQSRWNDSNSYLAGKSCQLYRSPWGASSTRNLTIATPPKSPPPSYCHNLTKFSNLGFRAKAKTEDNELDTSSETDSESDSSTSDSGSRASSPISRWSSNPEISLGKRLKDYVPPTNIENRILQRKPQNRSEPVLATSDIVASKVHPVPENVKKLLFDKIMLNNERRSQRVREQSKRKLLSQVKPFSFTQKRDQGAGEKKTNELQQNFHIECLNNTRPMKSRKHRNCVKTNNNYFESSGGRTFRANPAPPRSRALLAAIRLREQQEYRELKKRLRSETLMKTASLPPSMAARDKESKDNQARLQTILNKLENYSAAAARKPKITRNRWRSERSVSTDTLFTDDDRSTGTSSPAAAAKKDQARSTKVTTILEPFNYANEGKSPSRDHLRFSGVTNGVFESTSNDNNASRLRVQAAKRKEQQRLKREEEEQLRLMRIENARQNLRDSKLQVWRRACSYSSAQDIAMRRQLRTAASILERQAFQKDMNTMLNRVRSAPLLLEGVRERKFEPCKKHLQEMMQSTDRSSKFNTPRTPQNSEKYCTRLNWTSRGDGLDDRCGTEFSETAAMAEGTNSENESVKNIELDSEDEESVSESEGKQEKNPRSDEEEIEEILDDGNEEGQVQ